LLECTSYYYWLIVANHTIAAVQLVIKLITTTVNLMCSENVVFVFMLLFIF